MLNLGCGHRFNPDWINVDFIRTANTVLSHNLLNGIPFKDNEFDVVYHSHLLEHFTKTAGISFIKECYRVLKPGGIIRIAVPDLEKIAVEYLTNLKRVLNNEPAALFDYEWIMLEMYDQTVRNSSGGEMARYLSRKELPNIEYVYNRIGNEGKNLRESILNLGSKEEVAQSRLGTYSIKTILKKLYRLPEYVLKHTLFRKEYYNLKNKTESLETGRFRLSGEVHQWMYDRYSLGLLLRECGFTDIRVVTAFESSVSEWGKYELDVKNGEVLKPDSLFMEAVKPE